MEAAPTPISLIHVLHSIEWFNALSPDERAEIEGHWAGWRELVLGEADPNRLEPVLAAVRTLSDEDKLIFARVLRQTAEMCELFAHVVRDPRLIKDDQGVPIAWIRRSIPGGKVPLWVEPPPGWAIREDPGSGMGEWFELPDQSPAAQELVALRALLTELRAELTRLENEHAALGPRLQEKCAQVLELSLEVTRLRQIAAGACSLLEGGVAESDTRIGAMIRAHQELQKAGLPRDLPNLDDEEVELAVRSHALHRVRALIEKRNGQVIDLEDEVKGLRAELVALRAVLRTQLRSRRCAECGGLCDGDPRTHDGPCERDGLTFCSTSCSMRHKAFGPKSLWHAFECSATAACTAETGTLLDLRMPAGEPVPPVKCPRCGNEMRHDQSWEADWAGYGSRSGLALDRAAAETRSDRWAHLTPDEAEMCSRERRIARESAIDFLQGNGGEALARALQEHWRVHDH